MVLLVPSSFIGLSVGLVYIVMSPLLPPPPTPPLMFPFTNPLYISLFREWVCVCGVGGGWTLNTWMDSSFPVDRCSHVIPVSLVSLEVISLFSLFRTRLRSSHKRLGNIPSCSQANQPVPVHSIWKNLNYVCDWTKGEYKLTFKFLRKNSSLFFRANFNLALKLFFKGICFVCIFVAHFFHCSRLRSDQTI